MLIQQDRNDANRRYKADYYALCARKRTAVLPGLPEVIRSGDTRLTRSINTIYIKILQVFNLQVLVNFKFKISKNPKVLKKDAQLVKSAGPFKRIK